MVERRNPLKELAFNITTDVLMRLAFMAHGGWMKPVLNSYTFVWYDLSHPAAKFCQMCDDEHVLRTPRWLKRRKTDTYLRK